MVTDGFLLILVLLVLGAFIYCCISKKREQAARTHDPLPEEDNGSRAEEEKTIEGSVSSNRYRMNASALSDDVAKSVDSRKGGQGKPMIRSDFNDEELTDSRAGGSGGFTMQRWHNGASGEEKQT